MASALQGLPYSSAEDGHEIHDWGVRCIAEQELSLNSHEDRPRRDTSQRVHLASTRLDHTAYLGKEALK